MSAHARRTQRRADLSQHFLRRGALAASLVEASSICARDLVVEVGAGRGALTRELAARCGRLLAVEIDADLCGELRRAFAGTDRVEIVEADFLQLPLPRGAYKVFGSIPYARTAEIVGRLDRAPMPPHDAYLVVQLEAARRFAGAPWSAETRLSLLLKPSWHIEIARPLRRADFDPPPAVDSALIWFARRPRALVDARELPRYRQFVTAAFGRGGSSVRDGLRALLTPTQIGRLARELRFDPRGPASALRFDQWLSLFRFVARTPPGQVRSSRAAHNR